jgi:hypothetical protein
MTKIVAQQLKIGDTIMPPAREVQLWMRRDIQERGLSETALYLTITEVREGDADKRGRWLIITANHAPSWWHEGSVNRYPFKFKARPETPWQIVEA